MSSRILQRVAMCFLGRIFAESLLTLEFERATIYDDHLTMGIYRNLGVLVPT